MHGYEDPISRGGCLCPPRSSESTTSQFSKATAILEVSGDPET